MTTPPDGTVPSLLLTPPLPPRRSDPTTVVTVVVIVQIVMLAALGVYMLIVVGDVRDQAQGLRRTQDALVCQAQRTDALRDTATRDRQAQQKLFDDAASPDAIEVYRQRLADSEREREAIAPCPPVR